MKKKIATDHDHDKHTTTQEFNKLTSKNFTAKLKQAILVTKAEITDFVKKTNFDVKLKNNDIKITSNKN